MTGPTKKADTRRAEILKGAAACFRDKGLIGTSINDICTRLKISPGHLYYYFKSKDAIIETLLDQVRENQIAAIEREVSEGGAFEFIYSGDYIGRTDMGEGTYLDELTMWEVYAEATRRPESRLKELVKLQWRAAEVALRASVEASRDAGRIRPDADIDLIMTLISMAVVTSQMARFADPDFDAERYKAAARSALAPFVNPAVEVPTSKPGQRRA